jgi:hypothetical protein
VSSNRIVLLGVDASGSPQRQVAVYFMQPLLNVESCWIQVSEVLLHWGNDSKGAQ